MDAYGKGYEAFVFGTSRWDNPYDDCGSVYEQERHKDWDCGWQDAQADNEEK